MNPADYPGACVPHLVDTGTIVQATGGTVDGVELCASCAQARADAGTEATKGADATFDGRRFHRHARPVATDAPQDTQKRMPATHTAAGKFAPGNKANPGGKPKALREIEAMLDREHRNVTNMKLVFDTIRMLALRGEKGDSGYAKLYLERILGPVKDIDIDLSDAPPEVVAFLKTLQN